MLVEPDLSSISSRKPLAQQQHGTRPHARILKTNPALAEQFDHISRIVPGALRKYTDADLRIGRLTAMMYWKDAAHDVDFIARVREYAATLFDSGVNVVVTGVASINSGIIKAMTISLAIGYGMGFMLIMVLMIVAVGDVRLGLLAMVPNLLPMIIGLGVMGYLDIPLNTYNLIGGSIAIGLAVDDTIHFFSITSAVTTSNPMISTLQ